MNESEKIYSPIEILANELAYACNKGYCPSVNKEDCPFSFPSHCHNIIAEDWIEWAESYSFKTKNKGNY